jgi:hypothetical protein
VCCNVFVTKLAGQGNNEIRRLQLHMHNVVSILMGVIVNEPIAHEITWVWDEVSVTYDILTVSCWKHR